MLPTCSTATPTENRALACRPIPLPGGLPGFTLLEAIVMTILLGLLTGVAMLSLSGIAFGSKFSTESTELISTLRQAYSAGVQGNKRFEIKLDLAQQSYLLRALTPANYGQPAENDEIIVSRQLGENCQLIYVEFDDGVVTDDDFSVANFRAGRAGWQKGGKILLTDSSGKEYSIMVNRLTGSITLEKGDVEILVTLDDSEQ
jgi:type II secretory pathway pseudopilin PulG